VVDVQVEPLSVFSEEPLVVELQVPPFGPEPERSTLHSLPSAVALALPFAS
jgi:hypothetical protein